MKCWVAAWILVMIGSPMFGQEKADQRFEVASIKPNTSGNALMSIGGPNPNRFNAVNAPLRMLLRTAFRVQDYQIVGGPSWMNTERFDIEAKAEGLTASRDPCFGPACPPSPLGIMVQNL